MAGWTARHRKELCKSLKSAGFLSTEAFDGIVDFVTMADIIISLESHRETAGLLTAMLLKQGAVSSGECNELSELL